MACERDGARRQTRQASAGRIADHILTDCPPRSCGGCAAPRHYLLNLTQHRDVDAGLSHPRIRGRECLVHRFLNMIENDKADCRKHDGCKTGCKERLHGMLPLRDRYLII